MARRARRHLRAAQPATRLDGFRYAVLFHRLDVPGPTARRPVFGDALVCHIARVPCCPDDDARGPCLSFPGECDRALLSIALFSITFVSFPLLLDRDVDFVTAMITSVRTVVTSPLAAI